MASTRFVRIASSGEYGDLHRLRQSRMTCRMVPATSASIWSPSASDLRAALLTQWRGGR
jgi:hypothetical protein